MSLPFFCGIDLGTTNSTVSIIRMERRSDDPMDHLETRPIHQYDESFHFDKDSIILPSSIYFDLDNSRVYTGKYAKSMYATGDRPMQTIRSVKTRIGGESLVEIPKINSPDNIQYFDMVQCSALLLKTIRQSLKEQFGQDIDETFITVPAAFNTDERQATINAAFLSGFKKIGILDEPTAALLYYINGGEGDLSDDFIENDSEYKLVYDIGGGTLDVSIAKISEDDEGDVEVDIVARSPRMDLGGDDFDQYIAAYFLSEFEKPRKSIEKRSKEEQSKIIARIVSQAENYKIELNKAIKQKLGESKKLEKIKKYVNFEIVNNMYIQEIVLTKEIVDQILSGLINGKILDPVERSLKSAKLNKSKISEVLITGGMSNFYSVEEALRNFFGSGIRLIPIDSVTAVSKGAAIHHYTKYNDKLIKIKLKDIMSDDIFIKIGDEFEIFIPKTTKPDTEGTFTYTVPEALADLAVFLYSGTGSKPENFVPLSGKFIPLYRRYLEREEITIHWKLNKNKIISIEIPELNGHFKVQKNQSYGTKEIENNFIQKLKINE
ncbi:Hsp70 family protein [Desulfobacterales bacterium HSG17]|nr:Hsp70 family protein [Desulfobacterales bacterium HSG17]